MRSFFPGKKSRKWGVLWFWFVWKKKNEAASPTGSQTASRDHKLPLFWIQTMLQPFITSSPSCNPPYISPVDPPSIDLLHSIYRSPFIINSSLILCSAHQSITLHFHFARFLDLIPSLRPLQERKPSDWSNDLHDVSALSVKQTLLIIRQ